MVKITVKPIAGALGAVIEGIDIGLGLDAATVAQVRAALLEHLVIFFEDQEIGPDAFMDALNAGLDGHPEYPLEFDAFEDPDWNALEELLPE